MVYIKSIFVLLGTIVGAGIFALPFAAMKAGFWIFVFYLLIMIWIVFLIQSFYAEIVLAEKEKKRLPGYAEKYLGMKWKTFSFLVITVELFGAILAYLIIGGRFLSSFFSFYLKGFDGNYLLGLLFFFVAGSYLIFKGIKGISWIEFFLFSFLILILLILFFKSFPFIDFSNFKSFDFRFLALPYGAILFSLWGMAIIPEIKEMIASFGFNNLRKRLKTVIFSSTFSAALIYLFFVFIVLGVSGEKTSREAISGLKEILGNEIVNLGFLFGFISCFTSFITLGLTLKKTLWYDFGLPKNFSWFLTCFFPFGLVLLGINNFVNIISFTGAVAMGCEGIIIFWLYKTFLKKEFSKKINSFFYFLPFIFLLGIILELFYFLS